jgi:hypothetical protein
MPSSTGLPGGKRIGQSIADYMITGGLFQQATRRLLASGFAISWFDRFPALPPARFANSQMGVTPEQLDDDGTAGDAEFLAACTSPATSQPYIIENQKIGNRSNRSKYTCPICGINVWGKPALRVACVTCAVPLREDAE